MGIMDRILRRRSATPVAEAAPTPDECPHAALIPHWDDPAAMGDESRASAWECAACGGHFSPTEAEMLRSTEADRLKQVFPTKE